MSEEIYAELKALEQKIYDAENEISSAFSAIENAGLEIEKAFKLLDRLLKAVKK